MDPTVRAKIARITALHDEITRITFLQDDLRDLVREVAASPFEDARPALAKALGVSTEALAHKYGPVPATQRADPRAGRVIMQAPTTRPCRRSPRPR